MTTQCPPLILPFAQQLWSQLLQLPNTRMALSVLPPGVNAARVDHIVVSWRNGMLPRRLLSSNNPVTARALAGDVLAGAGVATLFLFRTTSRPRPQDYLQDSSTSTVGLAPLCVTASNPRASVLRCSLLIHHLPRRHQNLKTPSPMGLMALIHRGKTATSGSSPFLSSLVDLRRPRDS